MKYSIFEIAGKQYMATPGQKFEVDKIDNDGKTLSSDKVLLCVDGDKVEVGKPYLKQAVELEVIGNVKKTKIRVATYKAKANHRKVIGSRREVTVVKMAEEKSVKKA